MKKTIITILILLLMMMTACGAQQGQQDPGAASEQESVPENENADAAELEAGIAEIDKHGNITLTISPETMQELGYEIADVILVRAGDTAIEMPIGTGYSDVDSGEPVCVFKFEPEEGNDEEGKSKVDLAINMGNITSKLKIAEINSIDAEPGYEIVWEEGFDQSSSIYLSLVEKQGYAEEYRMHQLVGTRSNKRDDYANLTDAEYANFRAVNTTGMGEDTLFRSSSPVDPALNRNKEADEMVIRSLIKTVVNMTDTDASMTGYPDYSSTYYSECDIIALGMGIDFQEDEFREKLAEGFRYIASNEGPYLIHCTEGKDRTGFAAAVLECLMGADADEIVSDYMLTYYNFYGVEPGSEQYAQIADSNIKTSLARAFGIESVDDESADLAKCASDYLLDIGMTADEIASLKDSLSKDYGGISY